MNIRTAIACAIAAILVAGCGRKGEGGGSAAGKPPSPRAVRAILAKADEAAKKGGINFCGFYLGMASDDAKALAAHYGLEEEWDGWEVPSTKVMCACQISLKGVRRLTDGGNSLDELVQAVSSRVGAMKPDGFGGHEYRNIDGQRAFMSESKGLMLEDEALSRKAAEEAAEIKRREAEEKISTDMVSIPGRNYAMCKYEVTQALWFAVMGENPSRFEGLDRPVENVSWNDCQKFLEKLNALPEVKAAGVTYRLPTADEREYACRAGATGDYCKLADGTEITKESLGDVAWYVGNSGIDGKVQTHPVGQKKPNAFGLYDMHGNVREWTSTADGGERVFCGGSWGDYADHCGAGHRRRNYPDSRASTLGFRLAR